MKPEKNRSNNSNTVRVTIPAKIAYDLSAFQNSIAVLVEKLGCDICASGRNCTFLIEKEFLIDENLKIRSLSSGDPEGDPMLGSRLSSGDPEGDPMITVTLPFKESYTLPFIQKAVAKVAEQLNCPQCHSGKAITFRTMQEFVFDTEGRIRG